ncbi:histidine kinase [Sinomonas atrocyanea]|uniref:Histidine kinase n=1 Tax=Sinomonas atrocyanea TaxID=37927 RepID=A0A127A235_9MICC|nr:GAF domain-containing sensor histidine kinase [Sinomonas atrocyanea]AMM33499.1 histidine kinase [Sinomonas atrocyanea]GEB62941.1 histidine kinase [Sinomonas atrocyanea]GGG62047.1 histidine kinase [Sinomonas atrocyanea]
MPHRWPRKAQELLSDFVERAQELLRVQGHMNNLMGAIVSMTEDLSLPSVLESVAESAADIVGARSAAIGVIDDRGVLSDFITVGPDEDAARLIGHGALNEPVGDAQPDRLRDLGQHPLADGTPEDEPPLHFLGVPIRVRDTAFGNLYLIEKADGEAFTAEDEELASTLAAAAGVAIQNARLYEESRRSQHWLEAGIETSESLIMENSPTSTDDLALVAEHALAASDCLLAVIAHSEDGALRVRAAVGAVALTSGEGLRLSETLRNAAEESRPAVLRDPEEVFGPGAAEKLGQVLAIPLGHRPAEDNMLLLLAHQAGGRAFSQADHDYGAAFGSHVGLALELNVAHRQREEALLSVDRDRIAQDLHDLVIQRLFAAGLSVQSLRHFTTGAAAEARIDRLTEELDDSIRELRSTIYSLQAQHSGRDDLGQALFKAVHEPLRDSSITPTVNVEGRMSSLPSPIARQILAVVTEAVSNAAKHSGADHVTVAITVAEAGVRVVVEDDGQGFTSPDRTSGLANIRRRAASLGGTSSIESSPGHGTKVIWSTIPE